MKKILALTGGLAAIIAAMPAMAQSTSGTITVTGTVEGRCAVVAPGGSGAAIFTGTIGLGQLDEDDGTLSTTLENTSAGAPGGTAFQTRVVCTAATVQIDVIADTLATSTRNAVQDAGYANEINYTAELEVALAAGGSGVVAYSTALGGTADSDTVGRLAASGNNVTVRAYGFATKGSATRLLVAGDYTSTITVNIAPAA